MKPLRGAALMVIATAFVAASLTMAKMLGVSGLSPFQATWGRFAFGLLALVSVAFFVRPVWSKPAYGKHAVRIFSGWSGVTMMFAAAIFIPLSDTTAISFTNPVFAMLLAIPLLGEKIGRVRWSTAFVALVGALLLIRPGSSTFQPAALLALGAAVLFGIEVIVLKMLSGRESTFQIVFLANVAGVILSSIAVIAFWASPTATQWMLLAGTGFAMVTAQGFFTTALKQGDASFILPFSYATLLWATLYDLILFNVIPSPLSILGGLLIVVSGVVLALREGGAERRRAGNE